MDKFLHSRLFRFLVCLILVCCILVNVSPIRAKAVAGLTASAVYALLYMMAAGVVIIPPSIAVANAIGKKLDEEVKNVDVSFHPGLWDAWVDLTKFQENITPEWDPSDHHHDDLKFALAKGLLAAIGTIVTAVCIKGVFEAANPEKLPGSGINELSFEFGSNGLTKTFSSDEYFGYVFFTREGLPDSVSVLLYNYTGADIFTLNSATNTLGSVTLEQSGDIYYYATSFIKADSEVYAPTIGHFEYTWKTAVKSALAYVNSIPDMIEITPDTYVGDIPGQIQSGAVTPETLTLPQIDPTRVITSQEKAYEEILELAKQLKDGIITYDQFMEMIKYQEDSSGETDPTTPNPDPGTDPDDPEQDPEQDPDDGISNFTLDLKDYFPFCIPFDIYDFVSCLNSAPEAPVIEWQIYAPGGARSAYPLTLDLSVFDSAAQLLRRLELLVFIVGLAFKTRDMIKG